MRFGDLRHFDSGCPSLKAEVVDSSLPPPVGVACSTFNRMKNTKVRQTEIKKIKNAMKLLDVIVEYVFFTSFLLA